MGFLNIKKLFARSNIKNAGRDEGPIFTSDTIKFEGMKSSCDTIRSYFQCFVNAGEDRLNRLYVGRLDEEYPGCELVLNGDNLGQVVSIGFSFEDRNVVIKTTQERIVVRREP